MQGPPTRSRYAQAQVHRTWHTAPRVAVAPTPTTHSPQRHPAARCARHRRGSRRPPGTRGWPRTAARLTAAPRPLRPPARASASRRARRGGGAAGTPPCTHSGRLCCRLYYSSEYKTKSVFATTQRPVEEAGTEGPKRRRDRERKSMERRQRR